MKTVTIRIADRYKICKQAGENMIKIIWLNYVDRIKMNLILTIQIVMMIVIANIVISSLNGRYILYKPFEKMALQG